MEENTAVLRITCPACNGGRGTYAYEGRGLGASWGDGEHYPCNACLGVGTVPMCMETVKLLAVVAQRAATAAQRTAEAAQRTAEAAQERLARFEALDPRRYADADYLTPQMRHDFDAARAARYAAGTLTENDRVWIEQERYR